jgi:hypothetical protein
MKYISVKNYIGNPLLVYVGGGPKKIIFKPRYDCKLDLWGGANRTWEKSVGSEVINDICEIIGVPKKMLLDINKEEYVSPIEDGPLYFLPYKDDEYVICFSLFEKQPARYQCYVLAIMKRE